MADTIDIASLQTFSDSDLLIAYRYALATGAFRKVINIQGRHIEVPDAATCLMVIARLEQRIQADASGDSGDAALAVFGLPTAPQDTPPTGTS